MGLFKKIRSAFHDDWCENCQSEMEEISRKLYALPMTVGNYVSHTNPNYYKENLVPVNKKADIPSRNVCLWNYNILVHKLFNQTCKTIYILTSTRHRKIRRHNILQKWRTRRIFKKINKNSRQPF